MIRILFIMLMLAAVLGFNRTHAASANQNTLWVEIFTTADREVQWEREAETGAVRNIDLQFYVLDGIQQFETQLSNNLSTDPDLSKQIALQRIQQLDEQTMAAVQNAAVGLAKSMQYGIDRYPAILFDGEAVVYGLTDLNIALDHYRTWQAGARP
ncbi:TIGR03757 family integrating conjugative element protein [Sedimenticola selenatireducens]|uniref:TIGR03757 family integrating conjugative element protein n=1 Tax=Sedimenticola selenatireducens TaxID=191960 RepID=UPI0004B6D124|nr:TIGR03757 family integrating conjugative element protein [Sedimenticola selenatireducens]